jgi:hypothetical protein
MSILANSPDLTKIINKAIKRIGENHALARDNKGVEMKSIEIEEDRKEFRKGRTNEIANETMDSVIEESLKAVADEMAEKMVLENTIDGMIKDVIQEQHDPNRGEKTVDESTTDTIKKLVNKKLKDKLTEARGGFSTSKHPGLDTYEKVAKKSKTENDKAMKATDKKFKEYDSFEGSESPEFPHQENSKTNADGQFQYYRNT